MVTLLAPVSPLAWLPVAIYTLGTGNGPAVFLVFIAVFFVIVLATISEIDGVSATYLNVARIMGASRAQTYRLVILPAILPGLFMILRLNLFAAWMIVLIAELAGVGSGLGQVIMIARNTFNSPLVFFTIVIIGIVGFHLRRPAASGAKAHALLAAGRAGLARPMRSVGKVEALAGRAQRALAPFGAAARARACTAP